MARMRDSFGDTDYMDAPAKMLMGTLKRTLGMWVNGIAEDAAKRACERAHKLARERVAKALVGTEQGVRDLLKPQKDPEP